MTGALESALPFVAAMALCALRWMPAMVLVPVFAGHALGGMARTVIALALALPITPGVAAALASAPMSAVDWIAVAGKETALGIVIACLVAVPFWAIEAAGTYFDYQRGGNPQAIDPAASIDASVLGAMLQQALVVLLIHTGGLSGLFDIVWTSYAVWPALTPLPPLGPQAWGPVCDLLVSMMRFALTLAAPYLLALGAIEASFALLSRVNAKFPAYAAALPFKSVALLLLIALTIPGLLNAAADTAAEHFADVQQRMRNAAPDRMSVRP
ncbi:MAG: EscT/YscT/HrcT family type III secretion system export apparatus protein [Paraburkholderia sp.]|nr:MAG: EscT/YscT/HrcT family type III secretion system export apparatus protein [Paraburkholderia sp.]